MQELKKEGEAVEGVLDLVGHGRSEGGDFPEPLLFSMGFLGFLCFGQVFFLELENPQEKDDTDSHEDREDDEEVPVGPGGHLLQVAQGISEIEVIDLAVIPVEGGKAVVYFSDRRREDPRLCPSGIPGREGQVAFVA